jgi:hypothetical protein
MRKICLSLITVLLLSASVFSQLSTRENDATVLKLGSRPGSGDMALTFGIGLTSGGSADLPIVNQLTQGDILTFKYFASEGTAIRVGIKLYKDANSLKGDVVDINGDFVQSSLEKYSSREYILAPGLEKHFSPGNIFDAYAGADLYLGFKRELLREEYEYDGGDYQKYKEISNPLVLGLGGVVGFNIFIAQLPVSIGLEYGLNFKWTNEGKTKATYDYDMGGTADSQEYYYNADDPATHYSKLSVSEFGINTNNNVRVVLNIYFGQ